MQISNQSLPPQCGRNWRRRTRSSSRPTQRGGKIDQLLKWRQGKGFKIWFLNLPKEIPKTSRVIESTVTNQGWATEGASSLLYRNSIGKVFGMDCGPKGK